VIFNDEMVGVRERVTTDEERVPVPVPVRGRACSAP